MLKWSRVNIPADGENGDWGLAWGSDIQHLTVASDGTLYAYGRGLDYTLYSSDDGGLSWQATGEVADDIVAIATDPDDASLVYYATASRVYESDDGAESFLPLPESPGGAGGNNIEITYLDVAKDFTEPETNIITVGTRDKDPGEFGGVYLLEPDNPLAWTDTGVGDYDVYAVAFSPHHTDDGQLVAVVTDEVDTFVTSKIVDQEWGATIGDAKLNQDNSMTPVPVAVDTSAAIAFPDDYNSEVPGSDCVLFIGIDAGSENGDVYRIEGTAAPGKSLAIDLDIGSVDYIDNVDVTGLAVSGKADSSHLIAGAASSAEVYLSSDGGQNWERSLKPPTGEGQTYLLMADGLTYAATSGTESAFSVSRDGGLSWNQTSLTDTAIEDIVGLAPSPDYSQDNSLFMLTYYTAGEHSLWRSLNDGNDWERVYTSALAEVNEIDRVALSPQYNKDSPVVFLTGFSDGKTALWKSADNGQSFKRKIARFPIDCWAVVDDNQLFTGSYDGTSGRVYLTTNSGLSYSDGEVVGSQPLNSIVLSPSYEEDETILIGNKDGWVYWSKDNGSSFKPLPSAAASSPLTGSITVAFDPRYSDNNTVYAASDTEGESIYRFIIGKSDHWEAIDSPAEGMIGQIIASGEGTLYANNFKADRGIERCLNPTYSLGPTFETVTKGLDEGAKLFGLWLVEHQLWSVDSAHTKLMTYYDSLTQPVSLSWPGDKAPGVGTLVNDTARNISLDWETLEGAD
ncbi:MAG: WD40 repeat domain-containing protein, partial [Planctomycetes bacterium]|nr:WD40 repeat domain-containing protein [Planctomycetota bacterium]